MKIFKFEINEQKYLFREITIKDKNHVSQLFNKCIKYFYEIEGKNAISTEEFFTELPPNKTIEDKKLYGIFDDNTLIGVVDIVKNYPEIKEWIIGLMLFSPESRGQGLGVHVHNILTQIAQDNEVQKLRIAVMKDNTKGLSFWRNIGYKEIKRTEPRKLQNKEDIIIVLNYFI